MFVRFRRQGNRLQASLVQNRRVGGKVQAEHVGALGSVDTAVSVRERLAFWAKLPNASAASTTVSAPTSTARFTLRFTPASRW